jgi:hypothetical protein
MTKNLLMGFSQHFRPVIISSTLIASGSSSRTVPRASTDEGRSKEVIFIESYFSGTAARTSSPTDKIMTGTNEGHLPRASIMEVIKAATANSNRTVRAINPPKLLSKVTPISEIDPTQ